MPATAFLTDLLATDAGKFIACNIVDAMEQNVLDRSKAKTVLEFCFDIYVTTYKSETNDDTRRKKLSALFHKLFTSNPSLRFQSKLPADGHKHDKDVYWVTSFKSLTTHYINFAKASAHVGFTEESDFTADNMKAAIATLHEAETRPAAMMKGYVETWWHTIPKTLEDALSASNPKDQADRARDWLGLIHIKEKDALVVITIPAAAIDSASNVKRPTFVEAGDHPVFRSWSDSSPADWGRTVDLRALASSDPDVTGGEERVASPIPFPALDQIDARFLGMVNSTRDQSHANAAFLPVIMRGRNEAILEQKLQQIIS